MKNELDPEQYVIASISFETMMEEERKIEYMIDALMEQLDANKSCVIRFLTHKLYEVKHE